MCLQLLFAPELAFVYTAGIIHKINQRQLSLLNRQHYNRAAERNIRRHGEMAKKNKQEHLAASC